MQAKQENSSSNILLETTKFKTYFFWTWVKINSQLVNSLQFYEKETFWHTLQLSQQNINRTPRGSSSFVESLEAGPTNVSLLNREKVPLPFEVDITVIHTKTKINMVKLRILPEPDHN